MEFLIAIFKSLRFSKAFLAPPTPPPPPPCPNPSSSHILSCTKNSGHQSGQKAKDTLGAASGTLRKAYGKPKNTNENLQKAYENQM